MTEPWTLDGNVLPILESYKGMPASAAINLAGSNYRYIDENWDEGIEKDRALQTWDAVYSFLTLYIRLNPMEDSL